MEKSELQSKMKPSSLWSSQPENLVTNKKSQVPKIWEGWGTTDGTSDKESVHYKSIMELGINVFK